MWQEITNVLNQTSWHQPALALSWLKLYSFSLLSIKSWILLIFSSCWSRRSMIMPIGVFFRPAPSILFSSLFFMLRSLREAWMRITAGKNRSNSFTWYQLKIILKKEYSLVYYMFMFEKNKAKLYTVGRL